MNFDTPYPSRRVPLLARNIVATSQPLAAQAGLRMLLQGGNAIDAALAAAITLTVVEPTGNGLGSDAFAILWDGQRLHGLNASGRAPMGWTPARFPDGVPERGWDSVSVPGAVSGWVALSERFGVLPFEALFEPAIEYAETGFAVSPTIAQLWALGAAVLSEQPGFGAHFLPGGQVPKAGQLFRNPNQAESLRQIARSKGEAFYRGALAEQIAEASADNGAVLTCEDLAAHQPDWCGTISQDYAGVDLHEIPPNGQGLAALIAAGLLAHHDLGRLDPDSPAALHLQIEAIKLGMADAEGYVGDPAHMGVSASDLLHPNYLKARSALIDPEQANPAKVGAPTAGGTVYVTAADAEGRMASLIQSNYMGFGSGVVVPGTGIHMQNRGTAFVMTPGHANQVGPGKRPFHTIIPGFVMKDGAPLMSYGVMGGPMQAQGHIQMLTRTIIHGQSPQAASDAPRWRFVEGKRVAVESTMPQATQERLRYMGHDIRVETPDSSFGFGGAQLIMRQGAGYVAGSDHRKDGVAVGF